MIEYHSVIQIMTIPFPYPYSQVCLIMVFGHMICTPVVMVYYTDSIFCSALFTFLSCASFFSLLFISAELENPFGDDANDLPSTSFQDDINESLIMMISPISDMLFELKKDATKS